jgi:hypothetical protein
MNLKSSPSDMVPFATIRNLVEVRLTNRLTQLGSVRNGRRFEYPMRFVITALCAIGVVSAAMADDPPRPKAARPTAKARAKGVNADEPPPCEHMQPAAVAKVQNRANARRSPPQSMPQMFDRMMGDMSRNPSTGFLGVMKDQEAAALQGTTLTIAEERQIGRTQRDAYLRAARAKGFTVREVARDTDYLKKLVEKFAPRMKNRARYPQIEVTLVDAPIPDGQSFPGGFLVFTSGLLDEPDEATVAGVVAHELAHLDRGHLNEYAKRDKLANNAFQFDPRTAGDPFSMMARGMAVGSIMMDPFRPEHEHEADCVATTWLYQEGYSPNGLADFFTRMNQRLQDQPDNPFWKVGRSHPYSLARRQAVLERLQQLQRWKPRQDLKLYAQALKDR